jgi:outer membrane protein assembly factor BamB
MLATLDGLERVMVGGDQYLFALDPATGREVWRYEHGGRGLPNGFAGSHRWIGVAVLGRSCQIRATDTLSAGAAVAVM